MIYLKFEKEKKLIKEFFFKCKKRKVVIY